MKRVKFLLIVLVCALVVGLGWVASAKSDNAQNNNGKSQADEHRSTVSNFVQKLLNVADRQKDGIGEEVRVIAQEQNQNKEETADQIEKIEKRNKIKAFLVGTDYKNVGALRSKIVQTRNRIAQLTRLMNKTTNTTDKTDLQAQITALETEQTKIEAFLKTNESKFSLFGWLIKLLNKEKK